MSINQYIRYIPDLPNRMLVQAPTNYSDFVQTTPKLSRRQNQSYPNLQNSDVKVTKIVRKNRNSSASPSTERKISTGSQSSQRSAHSRRAPQERQPIMVASIANFDQPRSFSSVKAPRSRLHGGTQTDFETDSDFDRVAPGEISISIQTDTNPAHLGVTRKNSLGKKIMVDVAETGSETEHNKESGNNFNHNQPEIIAESPQLFIPATPSPPPPNEHNSPPPTPVLQRKKMESKADEIIYSHSELLSKNDELPPPPAKLLQKTPELSRKHTESIRQKLEKQFPAVEMTVQTGLVGKTPPIVPRKDKVKPEKFQKMKLSAARNAVEVHRRKSPQHEMNKTPKSIPSNESQFPSTIDPATQEPTQSPVPAPQPAPRTMNTPVFSDAVISSAASVLSDGRSTDGSEFIFVENSEKLEEMIKIDENKEENRLIQDKSPIGETNLATMNLSTDEALGTDKASDTEIESVKGNT